eukprot:snap_masked-scaffold_20-processed-gene-2.15-mRNA-1 protein AED:1.00 eAED:1.00 QI:0/0/0/0/1/1/2/0/92
MSEVYFYGLPGKYVTKLLNTFRNKCLHCNRSSRLIRQPYNLTKLARKPIEILRVDYLYVNSVDSATRKVQISFSEGAITSAVVDALLTWRAN